jgi:DNA-binding CsgD family transcriptional regulator
MRARDAEPAFESMPAGLPADLRMRTVDSRRGLIVLRFSLAPLVGLTPAELEVARMASAGLSNAAIADVRATSKHTVARQIGDIIKKLRVGSRLALSTVPELRS